MIVALRHLDKQVVFTMRLHLIRLGWIGIFVTLPAEAIEFVSDDHTMTLLGRAIERIIIAIAGVCSLYLGYRLFKTNLEKGGEFEAKMENFYLKLRDVGPGVFFALFGAVILISSTVTQVKIATSERDSSITAMIGFEANSSISWRKNAIKSINTLETHLTEDGPLPDDDTLRVMQLAVEGLEPVKRELVDIEFGDGEYDNYNNLLQLQEILSPSLKKR